MSEYTPSTETIRSDYAHVTSFGLDLTNLRYEEFDRWLAKIIREEREAERQGIIDMVLEMRQYAVEGDDLEGICRVYESLIERDDK